MSNNNCGIRFKSKWGKTPEVDRLEFKITSSELETFLRSKIDELNNSLVRNNVQVDMINTSDMYVRAIEVGKKFAPLIVMLPPEVLNRSGYNPNIPEIFQNNDNGFVPLKRVYWEMLRRYTFSKRDVDAIRSRNIQRHLEIRRQDYIREYVNFSTPKIIYRDKDKGIIDKVAVITDPNPMIHEMLVNEFARNERFSTTMVDITVFKQNDSAIYRVFRETLKRGGKQDDYMRTVQQISDRISG